MTSSLLDAGARVAWRGLVLLLAVAMGLTGSPIRDGAGVAEAQEPPCTDSSGLALPPWFCDDGPPPPLLNRELLRSASPHSNGIYAATDSQRAAIEHLEAQAVDDTIAVHGLPQGDATAVRSWGRNEALASLWVRFVEAVKTPASERTQTQQLSVEWLTEVMHREKIGAAEAAAREYITWAGLDPTAFEQLVAQSSVPSRDAIISALTGQPSPYNSPDTATATAGFCTYVPPAPYQEQYTGRGHQSCFHACRGFCLPPMPSYDEFKTWGAARYNAELFDDPGFTAVAGEVGMQTAAIIAASAAGLAAVSALTTGGVAFGALVGVSEVALSVLMPLILLLEGMNVLAVVMIATAAVALVLYVIAAMIVAVMVEIEIFSQLGRPGELADQIVGAHGAVPDLTVAIENDAERTTLFSLLVGASLPVPRLVCDGFEVVPVGELPRPCLNASPIPGPRVDDPRFEVSAEGAAEPTLTSELEFRHDVIETTSSTRVSGHWFVHHLTDRAGTTVESQSLSIDYTDWDGVAHRAWLFGDATDGYQFVDVQAPAEGEEPFDVAVCVENPESDERCQPVESIRVVTPPGTRVSVRVVPPPPPPPPPPPDETPPTLSISEVESPRPDRVRRLTVSFSEPVVGSPVFRLTHDGTVVEPLTCQGCMISRTSPPIDVTCRDCVLGETTIGFDVPLADTSADGIWEFTVFTDEVTDEAGNQFTENVHTRKWVTDQRLWETWPPFAQFDPLNVGQRLAANIWRLADGLEQATLRFNKPVTGVDAGDFRLLRWTPPPSGQPWPDPVEVPLTGMTVSGSGDTYVLDGLRAATGDPTTYVYRLELTGGSGIVDAQGRAVQPNPAGGGYAAVDFWVVIVPTVGIGPVSPALRTAPPDEVVVRFSEPVTVDDEHLALRRNGVALDTSGLKVTTTNQLKYTVSGFPTLDGNYEFSIAGFDSNRIFTSRASTAYTIDTTPPHLSFLTAKYEPIDAVLHTGLDEIKLVFSEPVTGFDTDDLRLLRDGHMVPLSGVTLHGSGNEYTLTGLAALTSAETATSGYELVVTPGSGIVDQVGHVVRDPATGGNPRLRFSVEHLASVGFEGLPTGPTASIADQITVRFSKPVAAFTPGDVQLRRRGADPIVTNLAAATSDNLVWTVSGLASLASTDGFYELTVAAHGAIPATATFQIDRTAPVVSIGLPETDGDNGIHVSPVGVQVSVDDGTAELRCTLDPATAPEGFADLDEGCDIGEVTTDGTHSVYAAARDAAGLTHLVQATFILDQTAPVVTITSPEADGDNGIHVSPVGVEVSVDDGTAELRCTLDPATAPEGFADLDEGCDIGEVTTDGTHVVYAAAKDPAGHSHFVQATFVIDQTAPVVTITSPDADGDNGTHISPVEVEVSVDDGTAELRCTLDPAEAPEGFADLDEGCDIGEVTTDGTHVVYAAAKDPAGHSHLVQATFQIDQTAPVVTITSPDADGDNGIHISPVEVEVSVDDGTAELRCTLDPAEAPEGFADIDEGCDIGEVTTDGDHTVYAAARDASGHDSVLRQATFHIDQTAPVVTITLPDPDGDNGIHISPVEPTVTVDDDTAELRCILDPATAPEGFADIDEGCDLDEITTDGDHTVYAAARDTAGHTHLVQATFHIDQTAPVVTITLPDPDGDNGIHISPVEPAVTVDDDTAELRCILDPAEPPESFEDLDEGCDLDEITTDGTHTVYAAARDTAGHTHLVQATFHIDQTAPVVTITLPDPDGDNGIHISPVEPAVTVDDDTAELRCILDPATAPEGFADLDEGCDLDEITTDGDHTVYAAARDTAGHTHLVQATFHIDQTAPVVTISLDPDKPNGRYTTPVDVHVTVDDDTAELRCALDPGGEPGGIADLDEGCDIDSVRAEGEHTVYAAAIDPAGNTSDIVAITFHIELPIPATPPAGNLPLTVSDTTPAPGQAITISAAGFQPRANVTVVIYSTPRVLAQAAADADGRLFATVTIPADATLGAHVLAAVAGDDVATVTIIVTPTPDPGGAPDPGSTSEPGATTSPGPAYVPNPFGPGFLPKTGTTIATVLALAAIVLAAGLILTGSTRRRRRQPQATR